MNLIIEEDILNCDNPLRAMNNLSVQLLAAGGIYRGMLSLRKILQSCRAHICNYNSLLSFKIINFGYKVLLAAHQAKLTTLNNLLKQLQ